MNWIPDLSIALPAPRDDEPPELRRRIIAELRDHLECAFQRELVLTGNPDEAVRRVRDKFGDPAQLARKLWFDALKEKIVSQRLMLICVGTLTASCLAMGVFSWKAAEQSALATQALVERLDQLVQSSERQKSLDWVDVKIKLVTESGDEPPPEGIRVRLFDPKPPGLTIDVEKRSPESGELDFGLLNPGRYLLRIRTPWREYLEKTIYVRAGESPWVETIVCPRGRLESERLQFDVEWPDDLKRESLGLIVGTMMQPRRIGDEQWQPESGPHDSPPEVANYLIDLEGNIRPYSEEDKAPSSGSYVMTIAEDLYVAAVPGSDSPSNRTVLLHGESFSVWGVVLLDRPRKTEEFRKGAVYVPILSSFEWRRPEDTSGVIKHCKVAIPKQLLTDLRRKLQEDPGVPSEANPNGTRADGKPG